MTSTEDVRSKRRHFFGLWPKFQRSPTGNSILNVEGEWTLPIAREIQLTEDLAFIASSKDDSNEVMDLCVVEGADKTSIVIRVASNAGDLLNMVENLQGIVDLMIRVTRGGTQQISLICQKCAQHQIDISRSEVKQSFTYIVSTDKARILSRLKSRRASRTRKTNGKASFPSLLFQTINGTFVLVGENIGKTSKPRTAEIRSQCKRLRNSFEKLEKAKDNNDLTSFVQLPKAIILSAYEFDIDGLTVMLQDFHTLDPSLRAYLLAELLMKR